MNNPYYPAQLTPVGHGEILASLKIAWKRSRGDEPSPHALRFLLAHLLLETGGKHIYCYNLGNAKAFAAWSGGVTYYQGADSLSVKVQGKSRLVEVFTDFSPVDVPGHGLINRYMAFPTLQEGANFYIASQFGNKGFAPAMGLVAEYDGQGSWQEYEALGEKYADLLKQGRYYSAPLEVYTARYLKQLKGVSSQITDGHKVQVRPPLVPQGFDPTQVTYPEDGLIVFYPFDAKLGFRPRPPVGDAPSAGHCEQCKGVYAVHMGYKAGDKVRDPLVKGVSGDDGSSEPLPPKGFELVNPRLYYASAVLDSTPATAAPAELRLLSAPGQLQQFQICNAQGRPVAAATLTIGEGGGSETHTTDEGGIVQRMGAGGPITVSVSVAPVAPSVPHTEAGVSMGSIDRSTPLTVLLTYARANPKLSQAMLAARRKPEDRTMPAPGTSDTERIARAQGFKRVVVSLEASGQREPLSNLHPLELVLQEADGGEGVPVHTLEDETGHSVAPKGPPDVWLKLVALGRAEYEGWEGPEAMRLKPSQCPDTPCADVPGWVCRTGAGLSFVPDAQASQGAGLLSWIELRCGPGQSPLKLPLYGLGRSPHVELCASLRREPGAVLPSPGTRGLRFLNLNHIIGSQLREGGLAVGFHLWYPEINQAPNPSLSQKKRDDIAVERANDRAFETNGRWLAALIHSLCLTQEGRLAVGTTRLHSTTDPGPPPNGLELMTDDIQRIVDAVKIQYLRSASGEVKVKRLFTLTHGKQNEKDTGIQVGNPEHWLNLRTARTSKRKIVPGRAIDSFFERLPALLTHDAVWAQLCCEVAASLGASSGHGAFAGFPKGATQAVQEGGRYPWIARSSFSGMCQVRLNARMQELLDQNHTEGRAPAKADIAVWGHTSKGATLMNLQLRAFSRHGNMDICYMFGGLPEVLPLQPAVADWSARFCNGLSVALDAKKYAAATDAVEQPSCWRLVLATLQHPGALIHGLISSWEANSKPTVRLRVPLPLEAPSFVSLQIAAGPMEASADASDSGDDSPGDHTPSSGACMPAAQPIPEVVGYEPWLDVLTLEPVPITDGKMRLGGRRLVRFLPELGPGRTAGEGAEFWERDERLLEELRSGNMPDFCRQWVRVDLRDGELTGAVWVTCDVLAVGTNEDYVRVNLSGYASERIAEEWGCFLPTNLLHDRILAAPKATRICMHNIDFQSGHFGLWQCSTRGMQLHDDIVQGRIDCARPASQDVWAWASGKCNPGLGTQAHVGRANGEAQRTLRCRIPLEHPGTLMVGHKKEICIHHEQTVTALNGSHRGHVLYIYGGLKPSGGIVQGMGHSEHFAGYADYSHGTRLVYPWVQVGGDWRRYEEVLKDERKVNGVSVWKLFTGQVFPREARVRYPTPSSKSGYKGY